MTGRVGAIVLAAPLLLSASASDPAGDTVSCRAGEPVVDRAIDLVGAEARATEGGSAVRFTVTFVDALRTPDPEGRPLRIDVVIRDPQVPPVSFAYYRDVNRIVRFDSVGEPGVVILLLPERGTNTFLGARVDGDRLTIELPGRLLTRDVDLEGPALGRLRWSVVARDEGTCDLLGDGRPTLAIAPASPLPSASPAVEPALDPPEGGASWGFAVGLGTVIAGLGFYALSVSRRARRR
ncbi:MAG TPA: hypothetical protein VJ259_04855 [Actinomycetota bacterium]|nr:hypothetical protein [Actinomycetota bacterium]